MKKYRLDKTRNIGTFGKTVFENRLYVKKTRMISGMSICHSLRRVPPSFLPFLKSGYARKGPPRRPA